MNAPLFAFVAAKGGSGATTICNELARLMRVDRQLVLIDGDLSGRRNLAILLDGLRALDAARTGTSLSVARINGMSVVEMAPRYEAAFTLKFDEVEELAASFTDANCMLMDVPMPFAAPVRPFVVRTTRFIIVTEPTLLGIASARTAINDLKKFGVPMTRVVLLTNTRDSRENATRSEIERALDVKVIAEIPPCEDRGYAKALQGLERALRGISAEPQIESLMPSAKGLIQDRRLEPRSATSSRPTMDRNADEAESSLPSYEERSRTMALREQMKLRVHEALASRINLIEASAAHSDNAKLAELREKIEDAAAQVMSESSPEGLTAEDISQMKEEIVHESLGLGPLEDLMADPAVSEIMVNGADTVYAERAGKLELTAKRFSSEQQLRLVIERILAPLGRRLDESVPMVDARLPDGSRVNAIIEPLAIDGATLTIRRFGTHRLNAQDLLDKGSANEPMLDFLRAGIEARLNILISGGTGSGKTTFLNILSSYIPSRERIVTIEDAAELRLNQPHIVRLETRPANLEGRGEITIRDLVRNSLRMRPDRIVVGECRGGEALDMLQAMNTGHDGSLTTLHANSPRDAMARLETLVMMAGFDLPVRAIREQIASAIDIVVQIARLRDGTRKIISVSEIVGMEGDVVTMQEIVKYAQHGVDLENKVSGEFQFTGVQPAALQRFEEYGVTYDVRKLTTLASSNALW